MKIKATNVAKRFIGALMVSILFFGFSSFTWGGTDPSWVSLTTGMDKTTRVNLLESNFDQVVFELQIPGIWSEDISTKGGNYSLLSVPDGGVTSVIGEPNLPVITKMVEIPFGAEVSVNVESFEVVEKSLGELGLTTNQIVPVQAPVPKIEGALQQAQFVINEKYYQQNAFLPEERVKLNQIGIIRGHRYVSMSIFPISYNPRMERVKIYTQIKVKLTLTGSDMTTTRNQLFRYASPPFEELCSKSFINYPAYAPLVKGAPELPIGYLIITHQDFSASLADLVEWKTQKGFHVTVAEVPTIGSTKELIKSYIQDAYNNWTIPPTYVLFVGDVEYIPAWIGTSSSTATDLYYVKMDGDPFGDMFRGRLPAKNLTEANDMVSKILYYENPTSSDLDWMKKACFVAASDLDGLAEKTHDYVMLNYCYPNGMICDTIWQRLGGSTTMITNSVNNGRTILCYSGHGSEYFWSSVAYNQSDVRNLTNPNQYPFVLSHACFTGSFNVDESFGETWAKVANKAGIAFWGASNGTYWDEDDILEKRMFQAAFAETCYSVGNMTDKALWYVYQYYSGGGLSLYYLDAYNVMGDPSIDMWTKVAESLYVDFPPNISPGTNTVTITVQKSGSVPVGGALVCLYREGDVFETGYTDALGQITLYPSPDTFGYVDLAVTAHNSLPFEDSMRVGLRIGDVTGDAQINLGDLVFLVNYLYKSGIAPDPLELGDVNCDKTVDLGDVVYLIDYLYRGGTAPCS
jgi:hypothetical protein